MAQLRAGRLTRRLVQLLFGLVLYGASTATIIRARLGNAPWDVLHQGLARHLPISIGAAIIAVSAGVLVLWIPLRQLPGLGTVLNAVLVGFAAGVTLSVLPSPSAGGARTVLLIVGILCNVGATALYIGAQLGPGPRDGLMTGLHRRTGRSVRLVRTAIEVTVVLLGWLLGGTVGIGTVAYAVAIGPLVQLALPWCIVALPAVTPRSGDGAIEG